MHGIFHLGNLFCKFWDCNDAFIWYLISVNTSGLSYISSKHVNCNYNEYQSCSELSSQIFIAVQIQMLAIYHRSTLLWIMSLCVLFSKHERSAIFFSRSNRYRRSLFGKMIAVRLAIAKSSIGIAKTRSFFTIVASSQDVK